MTPDVLLLSVRADEALLRLGCRTLRDVCRLTANDLLALPNCGKKSVAEIRAALGKFGLCLHEPTKRFRAYDFAGVDQRNRPCPRKARRQVVTTPGAADPKKGASVNWHNLPSGCQAVCQAALGSASNKVDLRAEGSR